MAGTRDTETSSTRPLTFSLADLVRATFAIAAIVVLFIGLWQLSNLLLVGFAAIVVATILHSLSELIERYTPLPEPWSLVLASLFIAGLIASFVYFLGAQIYEQASTLFQQLPGLVSSLGNRLGIQDLPGLLISKSDEFIGRSGLVGDIAGYTSVVVGVLANILLVIFAGIYLAASHRLYFKGFLKLIPRRARNEVGSAMENAGHALQYWLLGQLVSMTLIGLLTTAGLYLIGVPSALALGFFAGVSEFVPFVGPLLSSIPALLLALSESSTMFFWVLGLYVVVQQIEGNLIMPLVQRGAVDLPPVVTLFALVGLGILFGPLGVLVGAPLTVVIYVAVKQLYVRDTIGEETEIPGEK